MEKRHSVAPYSDDNSPNEWRDSNPNLHSQNTDPNYSRTKTLTLTLTVRMKCQILTLS